MLPVDLALRVKDTTAAICLMDLRLRALKEIINLDATMSHGMRRRSVLRLFNGWDNDTLRCEIFRKLMQNSDHAALFKSMRSYIVHCVCVGGHVRLLEDVIRLLGVRAEDLNSTNQGFGPWWRLQPLWIAADNGNVDQVGDLGHLYS